MNFKVGDRVRLIKDGLSTRGATGMLAYVRHINEGMRTSPIQVEIYKGGPYHSHAVDPGSYQWTWVNEDGIELVTPSIPSPIVTETVTCVVPDQYGIVSIKENHPRYENSVNVCIQPTHATAEQLRHAASTLTALADHLESQKP